MFLAAMLSSIQSKVPGLRDYIIDVVDITPKLVRCCGRVASVLRIDGDGIVGRIVEVGERGAWEEEEVRRSESRRTSQL